MTQITVLISPTGESQITTHGFHGSACRDASRFLEESLGERTAETLTGDFYTESTIDQPNRHQA